MSLNLRVCLLTNIIPPYYISVFEHLRDQLDRLSIFVSVPMERGRDWKPDWKDLPVTVQKCWSYEASWDHEQGFTDSVWRHIPYDTIPLLVRERPDVVITLQLGLRTLQAAIYRRLFPKSRLIIWTGLSEHTEKGLPRWRVMQRRVLLRAADAVLVNGKSGNRYLQGLGVRADRIFPEPYCAEISSHLRLPIKREPRTRRRLIYCGQLIQRKGLKQFLSILCNWMLVHPEQQCEFWVAGDGPLRQELENMQINSQLRVRFLGSVEYQKLPELYGQGDIYVFPTLADEWGVVVNEALAAGLPVLGSVYSQAVEELVTDGVTGWTFRPDHPEEVYEALNRAMTTPEEHLDEMRRASRERIHLLTPEYGARCFLDAIKKVHPSAKEPLMRNLEVTEKVERPTP